MDRQISIPSFVRSLLPPTVVPQKCEAVPVFWSLTVKQAQTEIPVHMNRMEGRFHW